MAYDYEIVSGDNKTLSITVRDENNAVLDVSTAQKITYVIVNAFMDQIVVMKDRSSGIVATPTAVTVTIDPSDTQGFSGEFIHELEIVDALGQTFTALQGEVLIRKDYIE